MFGVKYKCNGGSRRSSRSIGREMLVLVLVTCMCGVATSMRIKHFFVPDLADLRSTEPIRLECDVEISTEERSQIVIQWYLNDTLLYLWSENRTTGFPYVNTNFVASVTTRRTQVQNATVVSPLIITDKNINLTGDYKCLVNINAIDEVFEEEKMRMYVPIDNITLDQVYDNGTNELNVTCGTENVYPRPELKLLINGQENLTTTTDPILDVRLNQNQLFDISATYTLSIINLKSSSRINCSIILPEVGYSSSRLTQFNKSGYPDDQTLDTDVNQDSTTSYSAQDSDAPGSSSTLDRINSYLISASILLIWRLALGFI